ncbi:type I secretion protein TolC [Pseudomonas sp. 09C 129]|uniref:TolC family outer membrane protein n=1 Tax=Pseudomonas sp. 09C 129 TaxID=2054915 RepID=UPI000C6ED3A1|nr:TolC family outer membrane protein [Pseudomonas sp. 09C 129]AUG04143.1 type I secretion protein TolC [Pseudomonas sp. 09C 129]
MFRSCSLLFGMLIIPIFTPLAIARELNLPWLSEENQAPAQGLSSQHLADQLERRTNPTTLPVNTPLRENILDLREAVTIAVNRHPSIISAASAITEQEGQVDVAKAGYYPKISAGMNSGRVNLYGNGQVASLSVSQMLHDFGKVSGSVTQAEGQVLKQQALLLKQIDAIAEQTAEAMLEAHRQQSLLKIARDQVKAIQDVLEIVKLRANSGLTSQSDYVQASTRLQSAQANTQQVMTLLGQWRARLSTLVGNPLPTAVADPPADLEHSARLDSIPDYAILPDVLIAEADRKSAYGQLENAKAQRYPTIALEASANQAITGTNPSNGEEHGSYNTLMLTGSMLLYQGGAISAQIRSATAAIDHAESNINDARLSAEDALLRAREQTIGTRMRLGILGQRMATMTETRALYRDQYSVGTRSVLDLLNAEQEVYQAAADLEVTRHDFWRGLITYINAAGYSREAYGLNNTSIQQIEIQP